MPNKGKSIKLKIDENDHLLYSKNEFDGFLSAAHLREDNNKIEKFSTGSSSLDNILAEGIETNSITYFYGGPDSGKSQICLTLCALLSKQYNSIYIDTECKFRPETIEQILKERTLELNKALKGYTYQSQLIAKEWKGLLIMYQI
jgi:RecA/RadA recombinase